MSIPAATNAFHNLTAVGVVWILLVVAHLPLLAHSQHHVVCSFGNIVPLVRFKLVCVDAFFVLFCFVFLWTCVARLRLCAWSWF